MSDHYTPIPIPPRDESESTTGSDSTRIHGSIPNDPPKRPPSPRSSTVPLTSAPPPAAEEDVPLRAATLGNTAEEPLPTLKKNRKSVGRWIAGKRRDYPKSFITLIVLIALSVVGGTFSISMLSKYAAKAEAMNLQNLESLEVGSLALDRNGEPIGRISMQDRLLVTLDDIPDHLVDALLATEDSRFFEHDGFDLKGIARAAVQNLKAGGIRQGGSTITQQLARHAFSLEGRTFDRKFTEIFLARRIEKNYSKEQIIESYFNRIYMGSGFWGVGSAARGYFGKEVSELNIPEAATLCALIKSPNRFSPFKNAVESVAARNRTLQRMKNLDMITDDQFEEFSALKNIALSEAERPERPHFLLTQIREEALSLVSSRASLDGLIIQTTVDSSIQNRTIAHIDTALRMIERREGYEHPTPWGNPEKKSANQSPFLQAAVVAIRNDTGEIVTAIGGRDFRESQFNRAWQAKREPGSAFLPFLYAAAYEYGDVSPITTLSDAPLDNRRIMIGGQNGVLGEWSTESTADTYEGNISAAYALTKSKNSPAARMALEKMTPEEIISFAENAGLEGDYSEYPNVFLGTTPVRLLDLVRAYSAFATGGKSPNRLNLISSIKNQEGTVIYQAPRTFETTIFSEETAAKVHQSLAATFTHGTAPMWRTEVSRLAGQVAGKSGTSYNFKDNWFIGYNGEYTWGVWIGLDSPKPIYPRAFGTDTALPIWIEMAEMLDSKKSFPYDRPRPNVHEVCLHSGCLPGKHCPKAKFPFDLTRWEEFKGEAPVCPLHTQPGEEITSDGSRKALRARPIAKSIKPQIPVVTGWDPYQSMKPKQEINLE